MRCETFVVAASLSVLTLGCPPQQQSQTQTPALGPAETAGPVSLATAPLRGDAVSGCVAGAAVVKVVITLRRGGTRGCQADLSPALVCVAPGGVIRWRVDNACERLAGSKTAPALKFTRPALRDFAAARDEMAVPPKPAVSVEPPSILTACDTQIDELALGQAYLYCTVHDRAPEGIYKYAVEGEKIDPLDPDVEVRPGR